MIARARVAVRKPRLHIAVRQGSSPNSIHPPSKFFCRSLLGGT